MTFDPETQCPYNFDPRAGNIVYSYPNPGANWDIWYNAYNIGAGWVGTGPPAPGLMEFSLPPNTRADQAQFRWNYLTFGFPPTVAPYTYSDIVSIAPRDVFFIAWNSGGSHEWPAVQAHDDADKLNDVPFKALGGLSDRIQFGSESIENRDVTVEGGYIPLDIVAEIQRRILINDSAAAVWLSDGRKLSGHIKKLTAPVVTGLTDASFRMTVVV